MQTYLKSRPVWSQLLMFLGITAGSFLITSMIGVFIISKVSGLSMLAISDVKSWNAADPRFMAFIRGMLIVQFLGLFIIPVVVFARLVHPQPTRFLALRQPVSPLYFILAIAIMLAAIPLVEYLGVLNQKIDFPNSVEGWLKESEQQAQKQIKFMLTDKSLNNLLLNLVFIAAFAGIGEELFFRGVLQRLFTRGFKNAWTGIILAAFFFSAFHFQFYGFFPRFILGIALGAIYWYSGSIYPAMLAHFVYDGLILVLAYFNPAMVEEETPTILNPSSLLATALASLAAVVALVIIMRKKSTVTLANTFDEDELHPSPKHYTY